MNALTSDMCVDIERLIKTARETESVRAMLFKSSSSYGRPVFCAGGDVKHLWDCVRRGEREPVERFFRTEYRMNLALSQSIVPQVSVWDGVAMGGGIGLSVHGAVRVATEKTRIAMPETAIGLFPDVGCSFLLPRLRPYGIGLYIGLTGLTMGPKEAVETGLATHYVPSACLAALERDLSALTTSEPGELAAVLDAHSGLPPHAASVLADHSHDISRVFDCRQSLEDILHTLRLSPSPWAAETLEVLGTRSPSALRITLAAYRRGAALTSLREALQMEYRLMLGATAGADFIEGVRAVLVDKDRRPVWGEPLTTEQVEEMLSSREGSSLSLF